jgi:Ni/Co efflux regulator RcnB
MLELMGPIFLIVAIWLLIAIVAALLLAAVVRARDANERFAVVARARRRILARHLEWKHRRRHERRHRRTLGEE